MCNCEKNEKNEKLLEIIQKYNQDKSNLIQVLHEAQELYGYLPIDVQKEISLGMNIPMGEIYGVVTFYSRFSLEPKGKYNIAVCLGTACHVKGSQNILDKIKNDLKIDIGQITSDGKFSLEATRCVGACGLAPVFTINGEVYGKATIEMVDKVLKEYMEKGDE